jgi:hypothetical protein
MQFRPLEIAPQLLHEKLLFLPVTPPPSTGVAVTSSPLPTWKDKPVTSKNPNRPLRLCEATGRLGWLNRYVAPGQRLPSYRQIISRSYDGLFRASQYGRHKVIDPRDVPDLLATFELVPINHDLEKAA